MGSNKVLMKDIAENANVSLATVSYILNNVPNKTISEETRSKVLRIANELCYVPNLNARSLASRKSGLIGILSVKGNDCGKLWRDIPYLQFINQIESQLKKNGYQILLSSIDLNNPEFTVIQQRSLDGVFLFDINEDIFYKISQNIMTPLILIDSYLEDNLFHKIVPDYNAALLKAKELHSRPYSFLISDKANNRGVRNQIFQSCDLNETDVLFAENKDEITEFLMKHENQNGIVINEYIALIAANYIAPSKLAVICNCGCPEILTKEMKKIIFENNKAEIASDLMDALIKRKHFDNSEKYTLIRPC